MRNTPQTRGILFFYLKGVVNMNGLHTVTVHDLDTNFFRVGDLYILNNKAGLDDNIICGICAEVFTVHTDVDVHHEARIMYYATDEYGTKSRHELVIRPDELADSTIIVRDRINKERYEDT